MEHLYQSKMYQNEVILICSHQGIINGLLSYYNPVRLLNASYKIGQISEVDSKNNLILIN